jgi:uncharacterized membrane protein YoaK (UPF0700 family)
MPFLENLPCVQQVKAAVALLLTFAAGFVDIVGYRALYQRFVANMTGNTIHLAEGLVQGNWHLVALTGSVIGAFVAASILGRAIIEAGSRHSFQRVASLTLLLEVAMILFVIGVANQGYSARTGLWMLTILGGAMGLQTVTLTRVGALTIHTTFVTGMLNKLAQLIAHTLFLTYDIAIRGQSNGRGHRRIVMRQGLYMFSIWLLYFVGAVVGTVTSLRFGLRALLVPVALLALAIMVDQLQPLAIQEEQHELEKAA